MILFKKTFRVCIFSVEVVTLYFITAAEECLAGYDKL